MTDTTDQKRPSEKLGPHYDNCVYQHLKQAIEDYLQWMKSVGYTRNTRKNYQAQLNQFLCFSKNTTISWEKLFTSNSLECFKKSSGQSGCAGHQRTFMLFILQRPNTKTFLQPATAD